MAEVAALVAGVSFYFVGVLIAAIIAAKLLRDQR